MEHVKQHTHRWRVERSRDYAGWIVIARDSNGKNAYYSWRPSWGSAMSLVNALIKADR